MPSLDWPRVVAYGGLLVLLWLLAAVPLGIAVGRLLRRANDQFERFDGR